MGSMYNNHSAIEIILASQGLKLRRGALFEGVFVEKVRVSLA